jgi:hypothetical protein
MARRPDAFFYILCLAAFWSVHAWTVTAAGAAATITPPPRSWDLRASNAGKVKHTGNHTASLNGGPGFWGLPPFPTLNHVLEARRELQQGSSVQPTTRRTAPPGPPSRATATESTTAVAAAATPHLLRPTLLDRVMQTRRAMEQPTAMTAIAPPRTPPPPPGPSPRILPPTTHSQTMRAQRPLLHPSDRPGVTGPRADKGPVGELIEEHIDRAVQALHTSPTLYNPKDQREQRGPKVPPAPLVQVEMVPLGPKA